MRWRLLAEWAGFQAVWFACALGASRGLNWPGVAAALLFAGVVLNARGWSKRDTASVLASTVLGAFAESALSVSGLVAYGAASSASLVAPAWIIALWLAFGATLPAFETLFGTRLSKRALLLAMAAGAVAGPLAYLAGARLGALQFPGGQPMAVAVLALFWGLALPLLLGLRARMPD